MCQISQVIQEQAKTKQNARQRSYKTRLRRASLTRTLHTRTAGRKQESGMPCIPTKQKGRKNRLERVRMEEARVLCFVVTEADRGRTSEVVAAPHMMPATPGHHGTRSRRARAVLPATTARVIVGSGRRRGQNWTGADLRATGGIGRRHCRRKRGRHGGSE
jgi:hypothetical protein